MKLLKFRLKNDTLIRITKVIAFNRLKCYTDYAKPIEYKYKGQFSLFIGISVSFFAHIRIMNLIKMQVLSIRMGLLPFILNWFGDYRSLRFLCVCFGRRTFYFKEESL